MDRSSRIEGVRHALLELHKAMIDTQRIGYERRHGRVSTTNEFLGLVLEHPEFEWIRAFSALIAQLDEWAETADIASDRELEDILAAVRMLLQREGANREFAKRYWDMVEQSPEVYIGHVKLARLLNSGDGRSHPGAAG